MFFHRKQLPDGTPREAPSQAQIDMMDKWHQQECSWAIGYVNFLEKHLSERLKRCQKCPYRNQEGSQCNDEIPD